MKTQITYLFFLLLFPGLLISQVTPVETGNIPVAATTQGGSYANLYSNLLNKRAGKYHSIIGTPYLYEEWSSGELVVMGDEVPFEEIKINVLENTLEVKVKGAEKVLEARYLTSFDLTREDMTTQHFFNGDHYKYDGKPLGGFIKKTTVGEFSLIVQYRARWVKPDQNAKIVGVDPRDKIVHSQKYYIVKNERLYQVKKKGDVLEILKRKEKKIKAFMKAQKTNVKEEKDLIAVLEHYQSNARP